MDAPILPFVPSSLLLEINAMPHAADALARLRGPVVPLNLCFDDDGVDFDAVCRYVDWLCSGENPPIVLLTYGSSEFACVTDDDLWELTDHVGRAVGGRALFIASTGYWPPRRTLQFLEHAAACGADAVKVQINTCDGPSAPLLQAYFDALADPGIPLLMWWNPAGWIGMMPRDVLKAFCGLARRPDIIGMKNDGDAFYDYKNLIRGTADADFAVVSGGLMQNMLYGYPLGSPAYLCPIAPFRPDIANQFYQHLVQGELTAAQRVIDDYEEPLMTLAADVEWLSLMKTAIMMRGLYPNNRVGNPTRSGIEGKELERVEGFYRELFQLERV